MSEENRLRLDEMIALIGEFEHNTEKELILECHTVYLLNKILK